MAVLSGNRIAWTYTSDDGNTYRVAAMKSMTDQAKLGGADGSAVATPKPSRMKMRRITVRSAAHGSRVVPVYDLDAAILEAGETVNCNAGGDSYAFTSHGNPIPESHHIQNVTTQST
jgi:hypothetical protein